MGFCCTSHFRSPISHLVLCVTVFVNILYTVESQFLLHTISESDLKAVVLRINPGVSNKRLEEILNCTTTRNALKYLNCEGRVGAILLQNQWRTLGEACTATEEDNIDMWNPPTDDFQKYRRIESYLEWQQRLVNSGKIFCNPLQYLTCAADQTCKCARVLSLNPDVTPPDFQCIAKAGSYCLNPGYHIYSRDTGMIQKSYKEPFTNSRIIRKEPPCFVTNGVPSECTGVLDFFHAPVCTTQGVNRSIYYEAEAALSGHVHTLQFSLLYGDNCNYDDNQKFLTSSDSDLDNVQTRLDMVKQLTLDKVKICETRHFLICGTNSTCECYPPTIWDSTKKRCVFKTPDEYCEYEEKIRKEVSKFTYFGVYSLLSTYNEFNEAMCSKNKGEKIVTRCTRDLGLYPRPFCGCQQDYQIGKNCTELTRFLYQFSSESMLPSDISDPQETLKLFLDFNEKTIEFHKIFAIPEIFNRCPAGDEFEKIEFEAHDLVRRIRKLDDPRTRITQAELKKLTNAIATFTLEFKKKDPLILCDTVRRPNRKDGERGFGYPRDKYLFFFRCKENLYSSIKFICLPHRWDEYVNPLVQRLDHIHTLQLGESCPRDLNETIAEELLDYKDGEEETYEIIFDMLDDLRVGQTRFCDKKAGLTCKFQDKDDIEGKCALASEPTTTTEDPDYGDYDNSDATSELPISALSILLLVLLFVN